MDQGTDHSTGGRKRLVPFGGSAKGTPDGAMCPGSTDQLHFGANFRSEGGGRSPLKDRTPDARRVPTSVPNLVVTFVVAAAGCP